MGTLTIRIDDELERDLEQLARPIVTHPRIYDAPTPLPDAIEQVECWLECPGLVMLGEVPNYWATLRRVLENSLVTGPTVHDGRVASLCLQHGVSELWTTDRDFSRFKDITVTNPLLDES